MVFLTKFAMWLLVPLWSEKEKERNKVEDKTKQAMQFTITRLKRETLSQN